MFFQAALWTPPERDPGPGEKTQQPPVKPTPTPKSRVNMSGTAFTVDLRDGDSSPEMPKINMSDSLSKFLPHKVRRSFKERSDKFEKISARKIIAAAAVSSDSGVMAATVSSGVMAAMVSSGVMAATVSSSVMAGTVSSGVMKVCFYVAPYPVRWNTQTQSAL